MRAEEKITREVARHSAQIITRKVIAALQRMTDCTLFGDDSELKNVWDEVCVQVQFEESLFWDVYEETIDAIIQGEVEHLDRHILQALWLQTDRGDDWAMDNEKEENPPCVIDDIVDFIRNEYVLSEAGRWTNARIRTHLERSTRTD